MNKFDVGIIGGGPAGYQAADQAARFGLTVVLFEKRALGGVCLNEGCIPTKTLLHSAKYYAQALNGEAYGVTTKEVSFDHAKVVARKDKVVKLLVAGVNAKMKKQGVNVITSSAFIKEKNTDGFVVEADGESYGCNKLLIASGSSTIIPNIEGVKEGIASGFVLSSREILDLRTPFKSLIVIGGGVIGLEMAAYFSGIGIKTTVIEMLESIGGPLDKEIAEMLYKELEKKGVEFRLSTQVTKIDKDKVEVRNADGESTVAGDLVLLSVGRKPNIQDLGLEKINIYCEKGAIVTDEYLQTNVPGVYAIGDVNGKSMLAHTAYREAEVAVNHIVGQKSVMSYDAISSVIYTLPEVACVGESEESAKAKSLDFKVMKLSLRYAGRFLAENEKGDGLCKILVEDATQRVIGVHLLGSYASEIIYGAAFMIESHWPLEDLKEIVFPHPTVSEIIKETLFTE